jgi:hypothetical protein
MRADDEDRVPELLDEGDYPEPDVLSAAELEELYGAGDDPGPEDPELLRQVRELQDQDLAVMDTGLVRAARLAGGELVRMSDAEVIGAAVRCRELASQAQGRMYRAVQELERRRPPRKRYRRGEQDRQRRDEHDGIPEDAPPAGRRPVMASAEAVSEVALAFTATEYGAQKLAGLAADLWGRLPLLHAELEAGRADADRVKVLWDGTQDLSDADAGKVDAMLSGRCAGMTTGELRQRVRRAVIRIDPAAAERRRKRAERNAGVRTYPNASHTATLAVENVPPALAAAAKARVNAIARAAKSAGTAEAIGVLEAKTALGLLLGTLPLIPPPLPPDDGPGDPGDTGPEGGAGPGDETGPNHTGPDDTDLDDTGPAAGGGGGEGSGGGGGDGPDSGPASEETSPGYGGHTSPGTDEDMSPGGDGDPSPGQDGDPSPEADRDPTGGSAAGSMSWPVIPGTSDNAAPGCARVPAGLRPKIQGRVRLLLPWRTAAGMAAEPGELSWFGPVTPVQARELAAAAAADPAVRWQVIVTDDEGHAIAVTTLPNKRGKKTPGLVEEVTVTLAASLAAGLASDEAMRHWTATLLASIRDAGDPHLAGVLERIIEAANTAAAEAELLALRDEAAGGCAHTLQVPGYRIPDTMRRWINARDQTCRNPVCGRRARHCDLDHTRAWDKGGRTCPCGLGALCRHHHQLKQLPGWHLSQDAQGHFSWRTPAGLTYTEEPHQYAI